MAGLTTVTSGGISDGTITNTDINSSASIDASKISGLSTDSITEGNTTVEVVDTGSDGHITFDTEGVERMRINNSGDIGIGTNNPQSRLHLAAGNNFGCFLKIQNNDTGATAGDGFEIGIQSDESAQVWQYENNFLRFGTNNTERMRIDSSGNVGIGTTSPVSQTWRPGKVLDVFGGTGNFTGEVHIGAARGDGVQEVGSINFYDSGQDSTHRHIALIEADKKGSTANKRGGALHFYTKPDNVAAPAERMIIDSSGDVGIGTTSPSCELEISGTGAIEIPQGTTAQRPSGNHAGMLRFNTTDNKFEYNNGSKWNPIESQYSVEVLVVAGGGCAGYAGGGAGGLRNSTDFSVVSDVDYTVTVGAGGSSQGGDSRGNNGSDSVFSSITSVGGGGGAQYAGSANSTSFGKDGGSGGGAGYPNTSGAGSGTSGQGNAGGEATSGTSNSDSCGGGGGAGAVGADGTTSAGGNGGAGVNTYSTWATATSTGDSGYYAGGGGGSRYDGSSGTGGAGGGGDAASGNNQGGNGTANTGGGGGGGISNNFGQGGSGIVIIRYLGAAKGSGGTTVTTGGYTYHTFTSSGTYTA